jgi:hypothetical protein
MHSIVFVATKMVVHATRYLVVSYNEMMMINNRSLVSIHAYLMEGFKHIPILLHLERLVGGGNVDNLTNVILKSLMVNGGLTMEEINNKLISFGFNGVVVFTYVHNGVITQITKKATPFMFDVHCVAHWTNLIMQTLSMKPLMHKLEGLLQATYTYFSSSPKRHLEQCKLAQLLETKGNKLLHNVETKWTM